MTQHGSTAFWRTSGILVSGAISQCLFRTSCLNVLSRLQWAPLCQSCTSRRSGSCQVASCCPALFSIKINNIVNAVLKATDCSLFVDDFALCVHCKSLNRVKRPMQLCVKIGCLGKVLSSLLQRWCASTFTSRPEQPFGKDAH